MAEELRVLVPYEEWENLQKIAKEHEKCTLQLERAVKSDSLSTKVGEGLCTIESSFSPSTKPQENVSLVAKVGEGAFISGSGDEASTGLSFVMPKSFHHDQDNIDQSASNFPKNVIVDKAIESPTIAKHGKSLSNTDVILQIDEEFKPQAKLLLDKLSAYPHDFSFDDNGIVTIFGSNYPGN